MQSPDPDYPSFSVVVPTYQRRQAVCDAVRALSKVEYRGRFEVIVVVDGSTDGTAAALTQLSSPVHLRIIEQPNRGLACARNRGAAEADGDVLLFLDDDMICEPDLLEEHARSYREGADAVLGDFPPAADPRAGFLADAATRGQYRKGLPLTPFDIFCGHMSVKRGIFDALGGFDESFSGDGKYGNEDIDFGRRLLRQAEVRHNPRAICHQRSLVGPRELMRRSRRLADADLQFAAKHPELGPELFDRRGASRMSRKVRLLSRIPLFPSLFGQVVTCAAEIGLRTPFRSSPHLARLFLAGYALNYWSTVQKNGGNS